MKHYLTILLILVLSSQNFGQSTSLNKERISKLKRSVGKISIEGDPSTGTGFFFTVDGAIMTCWHVIKSAIVTDSLYRLKEVKRIFFERATGEKVEVGIPDVFFTIKALNENAVVYDFCVLFPIKPVTDFSWLSLGNFDDIDEGDDIYTCGYPLGLKYQFVSKGILSTKIVDSVYYFDGSPHNKLPRSLALLDLTINKGNSGGPIVKIGDTIDEDKVIGIANFNINPFGSTAESLNQELKKGQNVVLPTGVSLTESMILFSNAITYSSNGISGCVSINHFLQSAR